MALPASDSFIGANGTSLTAHSASWTNNDGAMQIQSNSLAANHTADDAIAHWNADVFNNDQYSQCTLVAISTTHMGVAVRCDPSAITAYVYYADSSSVYIYKTVANTWTLVASSSTVAPAVNDVMKILVVGTNITTSRNGVTDSYGVKTDSAITSGSSGVAGFGTLTTFRIGSWVGDNSVSATIDGWGFSSPVPYPERWKVVSY